MSSDSTENFERFRLQVLNDMLLQERLRDLSEKEEFINRVVALGAENGFIFTSEDVKEAMQKNTLTWIERWL